MCFLCSHPHNVKSSGIENRLSKGTLQQYTPVAADQQVWSVTSHVVKMNG